MELSVSQNLQGSLRLRLKPGKTAKRLRVRYVNGKRIIVIDPGPDHNWPSKHRTLRRMRERARERAGETTHEPEVETRNIEGEVLAFRGWSVGYDGQSYSLVSDYLLNPAYWLPGQPAKAQCHRWRGDDSHDPPHWNCTCGFYAAKEPTGSIGDIIGTVAMWGRYVEHEGGWRAEYAYPKSVTSLKCSECSQVFPWGTMKYLTTSTQEP